MKLKFQKMEKYTEGESEKKDEGKKRRRKGLARLASCSTDGKINLEV